MRLSTIRVAEFVRILTASCRRGPTSHEVGYNAVRNAIQTTESYFKFYHCPAKTLGRRAFAIEPVFAYLLTLEVRLESLTYDLALGLSISP